MTKWCGYPANVPTFAQIRHSLKFRHLMAVTDGIRNRVPSSPAIEGSESQLSHACSNHLGGSEAHLSITTTSLLAILTRF